MSLRRRGHLLSPIPTRVVLDGVVRPARVCVCPGQGHHDGRHVGPRWDAPGVCAWGGDVLVELEETGERYVLCPLRAGELDAALREAGEVHAVLARPEGRGAQP